MTRKETRQRVAEYLKAHPELTYKQVAEKLHCGASTIGGIAREFSISRQRKALCEIDLTKLDDLNPEEVTGFETAAEEASNG